MSFESNYLSDDIDNELTDGKVDTVEGREDDTIGDAPKGSNEDISHPGSKYGEKRDSLDEFLSGDEDEEHVGQENVQPSQDDLEDYVHDDGYTDDNTDDNYDSEGQYYTDSEYNMSHAYDQDVTSDWRSLQQEYLVRQAHKQQQTSRNKYATREPSPAPRQRAGGNFYEEGEIDVSDRLYRHALDMKRKKDARYKWKKQQEEKVVEPKLDLVAKKSQHVIAREERSSSTPRYLHLYDQRLVKERKERLRQREKEQIRKETNQLRLSTRSFSRSRASSTARGESSAPRYMLLYETARMKQKKAEDEKKERERRARMKKNVDTPERVNRLYEMSKKKQDAGKQRRYQIECSKKQQAQRSVSVGARKKITEPLDIGLYDRGMAKLFALEVRRAKAAKERDDGNYKESPILR